MGKKWTISRPHTPLYPRGSRLVWRDCKCPLDKEEQFNYGNYPLDAVHTVIHLDGDCVITDLCPEWINCLWFEPARRTWYYVPGITSTHLPVVLVRAETVIEAAALATNELCKISDPDIFYVPHSDMQVLSFDKSNIKTFNKEKVVSNG